MASLFVMETNISNDGYYLPLHPNTFETAWLIAISSRTEGFGTEEKQKTDKYGVPVRVVSALVKMAGGAQAMRDANPLGYGRDIGNRDFLVRVAHRTTVLQSYAGLV